MRTIELTEKEARVARGEYQRQLLFEGHQPGILSGSALKGKARLYNDRYRTSRNNFISRVTDKFGVGAPKMWYGEGDGRKERRVWVDENRERVRFFLKDE